MDALAYASIENIIPDDKLQTEFNPATLSDVVNFSSAADMVASKKKLNKILNKTQLKRACCLYHNSSSANEGVRSIGVRMVPPVGVEIKNEAGKKYGYYDKYTSINVNPETCNNLDGDNKPYVRGTDKCDDFYKVYSKNVLYDYMTKLNPPKTPDAIDYTDIGNYKPDSICYANIPPIFKQLGDPVPKCIIKGCGAGGGLSESNIYLDEASRKSSGCAICFQNFDSSLITNSDIQAKMNQTCGGGKFGNIDETTTGDQTASSTGVRATLAPTTAPTTATTTPPSFSTSGITTGQIAGLSVAGFCCCLSMLILLYFLFKK